MRALVTGGAGLLGTALARDVPAGVELAVTVHRTAAPTVTAVTAHRVDLAEPGAFDAVVEVFRPDVVVHTAYDKADLERGVVAATAAVAQTCARHGAALVHVSTDALFDGEHAPYDEADLPSPIHPYGRAKASAEAVVSDRVPDAAVVRTSLMIRAEPADPTSAWVIEANGRGEVVTLFSDEIRTPVSVDDVAGGIWRIVALPRSERAGVWHLGGAERLSRVELGELLAARFQLDRSLLRSAPSSSIAGPRPRDVSLASGRAIGRLGWAPRPIGAVLRRV